MTMHYYYYFELVAIIVFLVIIFATMYNKMMIFKTSKLLLLISIAGIASSIIEVLYATIDFSDGNALGMLSTYIIIRNLILIFYMYYLFMTIRVNTFNKKNLILSILLIPYIVLIIAFMINFRTRFMYDVVDDRLQVYAGSTIVYLVSAFYLLLMLFTLVIYNKSMMTKKLYFIFADIIIIGLTMLFQTLFSYLFIEMLGISVAVLLLLLTTERAENMLDAQTMTYKNTAYRTDLKIDYFHKKKYPIIYITITDISSIASTISNEEMVEFKLNFSKVIKMTCKEVKLKSELYYTNNGKFALFINNKSEENIDEFFTKFNYNIKDDNKFHFTELNPKINMIEIKINIDILDYQNLLDFSYNFENYVIFNEKNYAKYKELSNREEIELITAMPKKIENGLKNHLFEVFYQPIYDINKDKFISAEALIRLKDGNGGYISPYYFINVAEKVGTIEKIGEFVYKEVCKFVTKKEFNKLGLEYIELNVSPKQIINPSFAANFIQIAKEMDVDPAKINLEITESASFINDEIVMKNMTELKKFGFTFSLDDFGTGYSNIKRVVQMPFSIIKMDKSFVDEARKTDEMKAIIESNVSSFHEINRHVLIEGIEDNELLNYFKSLNCDYIQGFIFSKPLSYKDFVNFIEEKNKKD